MSKRETTAPMDRRTFLLKSISGLGIFGWKMLIATPPAQAQTIPFGFWRAASSPLYVTQAVLLAAASGPAPVRATQVRMVVGANGGESIRFTQAQMVVGANGTTDLRSTQTMLLVAVKT